MKNFIESRKKERKKLKKFTDAYGNIIQQTKEIKLMRLHGSAHSDLYGNSETLTDITSGNTYVYYGKQWKIAKECAKYLGTNYILATYTVTISGYFIDNPILPVTKEPSQFGRIYCPKVLSVLP